MKMLKLSILLFPLLNLGCGESDLLDTRNDTNITSVSQEKALLKELGFNFENEKISLDINKTSNFFKRMEIEMHGKADALQHKIEKADINFSRDIGISVEGEKVEIDFNKTKKMFQQINILLKEVLLEQNSSKY